MLKPINLHKCDIGVLFKEKRYYILFNLIEKVEHEVNSTNNKALIELNRIRKYELYMIEDELASRSGSIIVNSAATLMITVLITYLSIFFGYLGSFFNGTIVSIINYSLNNHIVDIGKEEVKKLSMYSP